jgi:hypothetical protein
MQKCSRCLTEKPVTEFSPSRRGKNGYPCRACVAIESSERRSSYGTQSTYRCGKCKKEKPAEDFTSSKRTNGSYCKECCAETAKTSREESAGEIEFARRLARYGLSKEDFYEILFRQKGRCAICNEFGFTSLHIDHDERTGVVRGLLCGTCNRGIGCLKHNTDYLTAAINYLNAARLETETM